ncbi:MAG: hypothetical protein P4L51_03345, partial [Puia sp.]|nr:hypothetical protein [Puia sp.]
KAWMLFWRSFPLVLGVFVALTIEICTPVSTSAAEVVGTEITGVFVDVSRIHHDANSNGDTWDYIWTADNALYSFNCDGRGYGTKSQNVSFNFLKVDQWDALTGSNVNPMDYGKSTQAAPNASNWKVTGADSIDGTIYAFIAENWYGAQNAFGGEAPESYIRQSVTNMSLIKSADKGQTWTRDSQTNYDHPMWTSHKFSTAFFVKYGQDGGKTQQDNQNRYVYAISNNGYWNCGSEFYLGRVPRSKIMNLNPTDWEFLSNGKWVTNPDDATPIPGFSNGRMKDTMGSPI